MRYAITGHQGLDPATTAEVRRLLERLLQARVGGELLAATSLAEGPDQLFAELVLQRGGAIRVIVPSQDYESTFEDVEHRRRYEALLSRAVQVETLGFKRPQAQAFLAAGRRVVDVSDELVAIWDGLPARGAGGTADIVEYARSRTVPVTVVWPEGATRSEA